MRLSGLDIGTTGCKLSVFDPDGAMLGSVYRDYPARRTHQAHEIDADAIWEAVRQVLAEAARTYPGIGGLGVTSFGETFVLLDEDDAPLAPAMLYTDPRGESQCAALSEALGEMTIADITGVKPHPMYSLPKIMWMKERRPEVFARVRRVMLMEDYIVYKLTGVAQIDYSLATRTMAFDIRRLCWSEYLLNAAGLDPALFSRPVPTGTPAGRIRPELARSLGLDSAPLIVSVSHDQVAAAIGSGVFDGSATVDGAGTVECMTPVFTDFDAREMARCGYCIVPFIRPGSYVTYAFSYTGGALVKWFIEQLGGHAVQESRETGASVYSLLEGEADGVPTGLLVLPHFSGAGTPRMDAGSRGAILGLTLSHTQQDIYRAVMEGVCYEMRLNQERLAAAGIPIAPLRATGGGARSAVWLQMKADILNVPVTALSTAEAGAAGSAMLVGVAVGIFRDLPAAAQAMIREKRAYLPRPEAHARYMAVYERYKKVYDAIRPLMEESTCL